MQNFWRFVILDTNKNLSSYSNARERQLSNFYLNKRRNDDNLLLRLFTNECFFKYNSDFQDEVVIEYAWNYNIYYNKFTESSNQWPCIQH